MTGAVAARCAADADLDAYAAQAAHQLGEEAVALLRGYTVVLEHHRDADPEVAEAVRGLSVGTARVQRFVDDLLDLAAASHREPAGEPVDLAVAVEAAREGLAAEIEATGVRVEVGPLPVVHGDRDLVTRLLVHALRDALAADAGTIAIQAVADATSVRVDVRDDGDEPTGDHFAPFARARGRGPLVGAGVGMTVCRRIVERLGGSISRQADADGAVLLSFTLPARR